MLIYVAGPYSSSKPEGIDQNIETARMYARKLWEAGHAVICPHLNTAHFEQDCTATYEMYMTGDLNMIARCDALFMLPNWEMSKGAVQEYNYAVGLNIPIYHYQVGIPGLHPTELHSPIQAQAFRETTGQMYRLHLSKNADYSSANIIGPGEYGLATRLWDKIVRLMNLVGFQLFMETNDDPTLIPTAGFWSRWLWRAFRLIMGRIVVVTGWKYVVGKDPKHESIDDTLLDAAVYPVIWRQFRAGKWGR